jgi:nucleoside-diphosphate kinase
MTKQYILTYYYNKNGQPNELALFEMANRRYFLKKGVYDQDGPIRLEDMYINGTVTICARQFKITAYASQNTAAFFEKSSPVVHTVIGSAAYNELGSLLTAASQEGLALKRAKTMPSSKGRAVALELVGPSAVDCWLEVVRRTLGETSAVIIEPSTAATERQFEGSETTATFDSCALCIVRPHAVREGYTGSVLSTLVQAGLDISALQTFSLLRTQAENFYEVYKTVVPSAQYSAMIGELASGICLAIEVRAPDAVDTLRKLCGPVDVEIAKHLRPDTLRAKLGRDNVHNAVHCTDLPEDGVLESQYFFSILPSA